MNACYPKDAREIISQESVCVIGAFDGLHKGHRALVEAAKVKAKQLGLQCIAVLFDPDPSELFGSRAEKRLLSISDRVSALLSLDVDAVFVFEFTHELASLSPGVFVADALLRYLHPKALVVGSNFHFGAHGAGTVDTLAELGKHYGFSVHAEDLVHVRGSVVSSSRIRACLLQGRLAEANELLERAHIIRGRVEHGRGEGTHFGIPTANVLLDSRYCLPKEGVYAGYLIASHRAFPSAINMGAPVSFSHTSQAPLLEAHLLGFEGNLYDEEVCIVFCAWLRDQQVFSSLEELKIVVGNNIKWVQQHLGYCAEGVSL